MTTELLAGRVGQTHGASRGWAAACPATASSRLPLTTTIRRSNNGPLGHPPGPGLSTPLIG